MIWRNYLIRKTYRRAISKIMRAVAIPSFRESLPKLKREISRGRRSQNPLALITIGNNGNAHRPIDVSSVQRSSSGHTAKTFEPDRLTQIQFILCGPVIRDAVREMDITTYDGANNRYIIALPETNKYQALQMMQRLNKILGEQVAGQLAVGIAEYPADGLHVDELLLSATNDAGEERKKTKN